MNGNESHENIEIDKYTYFAEKLSKKEFGKNFESIIPLGIETPALFPEYNRIEFKVFLKDRTEMFLNLFLKDGKITGYDFVVKE